MEDKKQSKKLKDALLQLFSADMAQAMKGLKTISEYGDASTIKPMLDVYMLSQEEEFRGEISYILMNLKTESAIEPLIEALEDETYAEEQGLILAALWSSGFFPSEHLDKITKAAIEGDYMCAVEAITVIENMEGPFQFDAIEEATLLVDQFLSEDSADPKIALIESLRDLLVDFRANMED